MRCLNIKLVIEYEGREFAGWQKQANSNSIQATLEAALFTVLGRKVALQGSGRTDSGVHARGQVANFHTDSPIAPERWSHVLNFHLPPKIRVISSRRVPDKFNALRDAIGKTYAYRILNRSASSALDTQLYFIPREIDWTRIEAALPYFLGTHDFRSFQNSKADSKTTVRTIYRFEFFTEGPGIYRLEVDGSGFLKQMVRAMVGTLLEIGAGLREVESIPGILAERDRRAAGPTAPADGLSLIQVHYPPSAFVDPLPAETRSVSE